MTRGTKTSWVRHPYGYAQGSVQSIYVRLILPFYFLGTQL